MDKDDRIVLSCALNGEIDLFVTGDKEQSLKRIRKMEIVSPRAFLEKLKTQ